ncbi:uncharacterized protein G2W53_031560 [Senna tora]|uniref:Uncharacterized protein n=1 Tax=Senna tora TaxID=362788 RepID=A0A834TAT7_9FABA|nr:uncharacterized protein G2W53_031560 [Senna tora]
MDEQGSNAPYLDLNPNYLTATLTATNHAKLTRCCHVHKLLVLQS